MGKRETVIESIKKLISLGVTDTEIAENLYDVGIEKSGAMDLINEAKGANIPKKEEAKQVQDTKPIEEKIVAEAPPAPVQEIKANLDSERTSSQVFDSTINQLSMDEQIAEQVRIEKKQAEANGGLKIKTSQKKAVAHEEIPEDIAEKIMREVSEQEKTPSEEEKVDADVEKIVSSEEKSNVVEKSSQTDEKEVVEEIKEIVEEGGADEKTLNTKVVKETVKETVKEEGAKFKEKIQEKPKPVVLENKPKQKQKESPQKSFYSQKPAEGLVDSIPDFNYSAADSKYSPQMEITPEFEELWKKGIVVAVNAKLAEMKHLKDNVDSEIREKVDEAVRKELYQYKVLMDSQKELIISSNKEALEQKQREIVFVIDSKIAELKQINKQSAENLLALESAKKQQAFALQQINAALEDAKKTKAQLIVEMNSEMIKSKSQAQAFLDNANSHLNQMDERINKTLELEKNIADGMIQQAEQKIESLTISRADELIANLEVELNRLQTVSKNISPEVLEQKIRVLDEFRTQFLNNMQSSLVQINNAIDEVNQKNIMAERALQEKTLAIDAKLEELTKFEKEFTETMEKALKKK